MKSRDKPKEKTRIETLLIELEKLSKQKNLHNTYVETILVQGLLKWASFEITDAKKLFQLAELLAEERDLHPQAQKARDELSKIQKQIKRLKNTKIRSTLFQEQDQLKEVLTYIEHIRNIV